MARFFSIKSKRQADREREELLRLEQKEQEERRKREEKEQEVKKLSEDVVWFKRLMAHNIRMPLAIIVGYGELLADTNFSSREEELDCIRKICKNIDYLDTLSKVLLDNEQEEGLREKKHFDVLACVRETAEYVGVIAKKAGIQVLVNSSKNKVFLYGNRIALMRAFFNLMENSIRYMNRRGNIYFTVEETEEEVLVMYRDDGEGMPTDEAQHITELNFQGSNKKSGGHGIGMYLVQETVEKQGGHLEVKTGKGNGMGVYMSFPKE